MVAILAMENHSVLQWILRTERPTEKKKIKRKESTKPDYTSKGKNNNRGLTDDMGPWYVEYHAY